MGCMIGASIGGFREVVSDVMFLMTVTMPPVRGGVAPTDRWCFGSVGVGSSQSFLEGFDLAFKFDFFFVKTVSFWPMLLGTECL